MAKSFLDTLPNVRRAAISIARLTVGNLPRSAARFTGALAIHGGTPVRDVRFRPWAGIGTNRLLDWWFGVGPAFRSIFLSGLEGQPQLRQRAFAKQWAEYCGCRYGVLMPHGTDALRFALAAAFDHDGLDYGGEVIVPNLSFIASATAALERRFGVAFVDVDAGTLNLDPAGVEAAVIPGKTRAIMPVHQFGQPADMTALQAIACKHGLKIIEDAAQAHGAVWESGRVGSLGDAAGFSFQSAKNLTSGEGGILTTNNLEIYERADSLHNAGRSPGGGGRWDHETLGWNCRATEYQAALLEHRFGLFARQQEVRAGNFARLRELLPDSGCLVPLGVHPGVRRHGMYMFAMRYYSERCRNLTLADFLKAVQAEGAPIHRCYSATMSGQPVMRGLATRRPDYIRVLSTPVADRAAHEIVYIPHNVFLGNEEDMVDIAAAVQKVERKPATNRAGTT